MKPFVIQSGSRATRPIALAASDSEDEEPGSSAPVPGATPAVYTAAQCKDAGDAAAAAGQWSLALRHWDAALAQAPAEAHKLHEAKAQVWLEVGQDWKAVQCARRAVELQPGWAEAHLTLARAHMNMGEPELAVQSCEQALLLEPQHSEAAAELASMQAVTARRQHSGSAAAGQRASVLREPADGNGLEPH
ncbi:hypothetical protein D9Q98_008616 [Chlorella vulgaris]|uniref:Uncharacterized protein n=1 Tax=Chlorella vulgaris TaxID=3077 RepID=A0A9D4YU20_CHLVU|nr:hypothetical protein D9Q98_008616 [Chlorella vulgaris]